MQTSIPLSCDAGLGDEKNLTKESKGGYGTGRLSESNNTSTESGNRPAIEKSSKKKKGKFSGNSRSTESDLDKQEPNPSKSKQRRKKARILKHDMFQSQKDRKRTLLVFLQRSGYSVRYWLSFLS